MAYAINDEGIAALKALSMKLQDNLVNIGTAQTILSAALDSNRNALGPHSVSISKLIYNIQQMQQLASTPVTELATSVLTLATAYQNIVDKKKCWNNRPDSGISIGDVSGNNNGMSGIRQIAGIHTSNEDATATNPNYDITGSTNEYNSNCQRCVPTYEARRRGYDVTAKPIPPNDDLSRNWTGMYKDPYPILCSGNGYDDAVSQISSWGEGARGEVKVMWDGGDYGHVFATEVIDGQVHFIDPQSNNVNCSDYFKYVEWGSVEILRTDVLEFTERIKDCFTEVLR